MRARKPKKETNDDNAADPLRGSGSGFFITEDGYLLTNFHVVNDASRITVRNRHGTFPVKVIKVDPVNDIAVLKASGRFFNLPMPSSRSVKLGDAMFTVGFPNPELQGLEPKLTDGRISSLAGAQDDARHFQISVAVQPGNSGGAWHPEAYDENGQPEFSTHYYPPKIFRLKPIWLSDADHSLNYCSAVRELLEEVYVCLQNNCPRAAAMAVRALLEHLFVSACGDKGTFQNNLKAFLEAGHISQTQREFLDTVLDAGHATMHRGFKPSRQDLTTIVDMVENVVELLYFQKDGLEQLKKRIPPRKSS